MKRFLTLFCFLIALSCWINVANAQVVKIPDPNLATVVRDALGLAPNAPITRQDMQRLTLLDALSVSPISDIRHHVDLTQLEKNSYTNPWIRVLIFDVKSEL